MPFAFPSGSNTYVQDHAATNHMVINFSRNQKKFGLNKYIQIVPVEKNSGLYLRFTVEEAGRILDSNLNDLVWADGSDRDQFFEDAESFTFLEYRTKRKQVGWNLGALALDQAGFALADTLNAIKIQKMMTARTQMIYNTAVDTSGYDSNHFSAVSSITGNTGNWEQSTTQRQDIKRSINHGVETVLKDTLGVVMPEDLVLVMGPTTAKKISTTQEIVDHVKHSERAWEQVKGTLPGANRMFGLPDDLYGVPVVVDVTYKVTSKKLATRVVAPVWTAGDVVLCSRPGALVNEGGGPSFSSFSLFSKEEMVVESKFDEDNRRTKSSVVEDNSSVHTAPAATFLFTAAVSSD